MPELKRLVMLSVAMLASFAVSVSAGDRDNDRVRDLYEHGDLRSLADVLRRAHESTEGDVVNVDLVQRDGAWLYRLVIVAPDGHRRTVEIPATLGGREDKGGRSPGP